VEYCLGETIQHNTYFVKTIRLGGVEIQLAIFEKLLDEHGCVKSCDLILELMTEACLRSEDDDD
jgi:hypothetical protein